MVRDAAQREGRVMRRLQDEERRPDEHVDRRTPQPPVQQAHALLALQQSAGNQAVSRMLARVRHGQTAKKNQKGVKQPATKTGDGFDRNDPTTWTLNALEFG